MGLPPSRSDVSADVLARAIAVQRTAAAPPSARCYWPPCPRTYSSNGFPVPTQASKPPAMLLTFEYPIRCRVSAASAERAPLRQ
jgi:hypothetical protein